MTIGQEGYLPLLFFFLIWHGVRTWGSSMAPTRRPRAYFETLQKTAPPGWVFGVVWFVLYSLIAVAQYLSWDRFDHLSHGARTWSLILFISNFFFNKLWSPLFFEMYSPRAALAILVATLVTAVGLVILFFAQSQPWPAVLLIPYVAWLSIALFLNVRFINALPKESSDEEDVTNLTGPVRSPFAAFQAAKKEFVYDYV